MTISLVEHHASGIRASPPGVMELYNTTAHQGLLKEPCDPPIPLVVLGEAKGRLYYARGVDPEVFARAVSPYDEPVWLCHLTQLSLL